MSDKTDFAREYLAWKEALKFTDDSPEAFEEVQRLQQVDRRVRYLLAECDLEYEERGVIFGESDGAVNEWFYSIDNDPVIVVTEEDIEDVPLD